MDYNFIESQCIGISPLFLNDEIFSSHIICAFDDLLLFARYWTFDKIAKRIWCQRSCDYRIVSKVESNLDKVVITSSAIYSVCQNDSNDLHLICKLPLNPRVCLFQSAKFCHEITIGCISNLMARVEQAWWCHWAGQILDALTYNSKSSAFNPISFN